MRRIRIVLAALAGAGAAGLGGLLALRLLGVPDAGLAPAPSSGGGARVAHVVAELAMRGAGVSTRTEPIEVSVLELNGFLARHVEARRLPLQPLLLRAEEGRLEVAGRTPVARLGAAGGLTGWVVPRLPDGLRQLEVWVAAEGRVDVRSGEAAFLVERAMVGRQPVPVEWLWRALEVDPREQLTWRLPRVVERVEVRPGSLLIHTRRPGSSRSLSAQPGATHGRIA
jgi:hypothetical protein